MKRMELRWMALAVVACIAASLVPQTGYSCGGTFRPNCGQTAWLAKFVSSSIVLPGSGAGITVPIGLVPYVLWNPNPPCAQPIAATLELTLTCTAVGGGSSIVIGPTAVPVGVPTSPGAQPGLTFPFPISGGTLPVGTSYSCLVTGAFSTGFDTGLGAPVVTGTGDTEACIVEEAPGAPGVPRFDFRLIENDDGPFSVVRRGDQAYNTYLAANNDPNETLTMSFTSTTNQVARTPQDPDPAGTLFALSDPDPGTDDFIQLLAQDLPPGGFIPLPDPTAPNPGITFDRILGPHELQLDTIVTRPNGMCANGSCSEALVKGVGSYSNGDLILGCAGTAIVVDEVPGVTPQCELTDTLQTDDTVDTQWSRATFDDDPHRTTHFAGNLDPAIFGEIGTQTTGSVLADEFNIIGFPPTASDYLRTENAPNTVSWSADVFDQASEFARQHTDVTISNLGSSDYTIRVPSIAKDGVASNLNIELDASTDNVIVIDTDSDETLYTGSFTELVSSPPAGLSVDQTTFREIQKAGVPSNPLLGTEPLSHSSLHAPTDPPDSVNVTVLDPRNDQGLPWNASSDNNLVTLSASSGNAGQDMVLNYDPATIAAAPDVTIALVEVSNSQALNSPVFFPVALRSTTGPMAPAQDVNYGLSGSWFNPQTSGQGFLFDFTVPSDNKGAAEGFMFVAAFTFDTLGVDKGGSIDGDEQRWFTAQGDYSGSRADLTIFQTRNGVFDDPTAPTTTAVGTMRVDFETCTQATITYNMPGFGLNGVIPATKLLADEICARINDGDIELKRDRELVRTPSGGAQAINYGLIGGWFDPATAGQGFLFDFLLDQQFMFVAWFTFDTAAGGQKGGAIPGNEQRWFTAQGNYSDTRADLTVFATRNGVFDDPTMPTTDAVGTMGIEFANCTDATITYDLPDFGLSGTIAATKLLADEICTLINDGDIEVGR